MRSLAATRSSAAADGDSTRARREPTVRTSAPPLSDVVKSAVGELIELASAEVKLARLEITASLAANARRAARAAAGAIPLLVGYLLAVAALVAGLRTWWGWPGSLGAAALSQVVLGVSILRVSRASAATRPPGDAGGFHA
jgi:hypothetical protein